MLPKPVPASHAHQDHGYISLLSREGNSDPTESTCAMMETNKKGSLKPGNMAQQEKVLPPSLTTRVQPLTSTLWKERSNCCMSYSDFYKHATAHVHM